MGWIGAGVQRNLLARRDLGPRRNSEQQIPCGDDKKKTYLS